MTLNYQQRRKLLDAQGARIRAARRARIDAILRSLRAPDYFQHHDKPRPSQMPDLRPWCTHGQRRDGADPYADCRGLVML